MNEFVEQFLIECRELVDQGTDDLLALEEAPGDAARLDSAFRAFHTLKGAAGIVDFDAMASGLHAVEETLSQVRAGTRPMTPRLVGDCLAALDQVVQWLDAMQETGEPPVGAEAAAQAMVARFAPAETAAAPPKGQSEAPLDWWTPLLRGRPDLAGNALTALRWLPDADSFFRGEDPVARLQDLPGLLSIDLSRHGDWPEPEAFDPFTCQVVVTALSSEPLATVEPFARGLRGQIDLHSLKFPTDDDLPPVGRDLIAAQVRLLSVADAEYSAGRLAAAAKVVSNLLRHLERRREADEIDRISRDRPEAQPLMTAFRSLLAGGELQLETAAEPVASIVGAETVVRALRVDAARIDGLVRLTGEITVIKNAFGHLTALAQEGGDARAVAAQLKTQQALLERLVGDLQRAVFGIRVLPMRHVFQRFPRLVREMGQGLGKPVRLVTEGDDTEADKAIVEALFEPLLHVLRNAVDHGLETPAERLAAGKPETSTLRLSAGRRGEAVVVEVADDGRGVDVARVRAVAADRGVATPDALSAMSDDDVVDLIFQPGFSTAGAVTELSGRGVGMDSVRTAVERLGGQVTIETQQGRGTTVAFQLPFTIMMTRVMTVEAAGQVFGIPLEAVVETIRIPRAQVQAIGAARAFVLRDRTIPLCDLAQTLGVSSDTAERDEATVVIAAVAGQLAGLEVDRLGERADVMLKPMDGILAGMSGIAGTTLLGDGRVLLVLDLAELLQ